MKADKLEELYREKFSGHSMEPSGRAQNLFNERMAARRRKIWYGRISVAASLILITMAGGLLVLPGPEGMKISTRSNIVEGNIGSAVTPDEKKFRPEENSQMSELQEVFPETAENSLVKIVKNNTLIKSGLEGLDPVDRLSEDNDFDPINGGIVMQDAVHPPEEETTLDVNPEIDLNMGSDTGNITHTEERTEVTEPVKITIEYIAGNSGKPAKEDRKEIMQKFYSNVNNLLYPDEILGDIRSLKDQLFALDFENEKKSETQNKDKR